MPRFSMALSNLSCLDNILRSIGNNPVILLGIWNNHGIEFPFGLEGSRYSRELGNSNSTVPSFARSISRLLGTWSSSFSKIKYWVLFGVWVVNLPWRKRISSRSWFLACRLAVYHWKGHLTRPWRWTRLSSSSLLKCLFIVLCVRFNFLLSVVVYAKPSRSNSESMCWSSM